MYFVSAKNSGDESDREETTDEEDEDSDSTGDSDEDEEEKSSSNSGASEVRFDNEESNMSLPTMPAAQPEVELDCGILCCLCLNLRDCVSEEIIQCDR